MICFLNRAELFVDSSQEAAAQVWSKLKANNIEYEMKSKGNTSTFRRNLHYGMAMSEGKGGLPGSWYGDDMKFIYTIYVRRKDLKRAKELCSLS